MNRSASNYPTKKVLGATGGYTVGKALATFLLYFLELAIGHPLPDGVHLAGEVLIEAGATFAGGWIMPPD